MIRYTHGFHAVTRLFILPLAVGVLFLAMELAEASGREPTIWTLVVGVVVVTVVVFIILDKTVLEPLSSWLYLRLSRRTPVGWSQARRLSPLLTGFDWYPMKELDHLPRDQRVAYLEQRYLGGG